MDENRIKLVLEGMQRDGGHVRLGVFLNQLEQLQSALAKLDMQLSGGKKSSYLTVVGLSHSSPATVEIAIHTKPKSRDVRGAMFGELRRLYDAVESNNIPRDVDYSLLENISALTTRIGVDVERSTLSFGGAEINLTAEVGKRIEARLADYDTCVGTIEGMLERINLHNDANVFTIYPDIGAAKVSCHFRSEHIDEAISSINRKVAVTGEMRYRKGGDFPYEVYVETLESFDDDEHLPTFYDVFGIAPDATGELSSEDFIRDLRNAWQ